MKHIDKHILTLLEQNYNDIVPEERKKVTPIIKKTKVVEKTIDICPHCNEEIHEKGYYVDENHYMYHRPCIDKGPIKDLDPTGKYRERNRKMRERRGEDLQGNPIGESLTEQEDISNEINPNGIGEIIRTLDWIIAFCREKELHGSQLQNYIRLRAIADKNPEAVNEEQWIAMLKSKLAKVRDQFDPGSSEYENVDKKLKEIF